MLSVFPPLTSVILGLNEVALATCWAAYIFLSAMRPGPFYLIALAIIYAASD